MQEVRLGGGTAPSALKFQKATDTEQQFHVILSRSQNRLRSKKQLCVFAQELGLEVRCPGLPLLQRYFHIS